MQNKGGIKMEKKEPMKISMSTFFLCVAVVVIVVLCLYIGIQNSKSKKEILALESDKANLQNTVSSMQNEVNGLQSKVNEVANIVTNNNQKAEEKISNNKEESILDVIEMDKELGEIKPYCRTQNDILELYSGSEQYHGNSGSEEYDKYAVIDIDGDGDEDLIVYDMTEELRFSLDIYKGTKDGFYKVDTPIVNGHPAHIGIVKESGKNYLNIVYGHMGTESIEHFYMYDNTIVRKTVLNHNTDKDYISGNLKDTIQWNKL